MPSATKATFSLDATSITRLQTLAQKWQVPKTEVLRRALKKAVEHEETPSAEGKIAALRALQKDLKERGVDFDAWQKAIRDGRR